MKLAFQLHVARRSARRLGAHARKLRRELRDHGRLESARIHRAERRARGLRLFAAWSRPSTPARALLTGLWQATATTA